MATILNISELSRTYTNEHGKEIYGRVLMATKGAKVLKKEEVLGLTAIIKRESSQLQTILKNAIKEEEKLPAL